MTESTGPKISSCAIVIELSTSAKTVGSTYQPLSKSAGRPPPVTTRGAGRLARWRCSPRRGRAGARRRAGRSRSPASSGSPTVSAPTALAERVDDLVVAVARREDAGLRDARLAVVHQRRSARAGRAVASSRFGVVEDDRGRLAAELERAALELLAADARRCCVPAAVEPVNATLSMSGWRTRYSPTSRPAGTMLITPAGSPASMHDLGQQVRVERRLGRRLQHDGAPGGKRRAELQRGDEQRHVPRHDRRRRRPPASRRTRPVRPSMPARRLLERVRRGRGRRSSRAPSSRRRPGP